VRLDLFLKTSRLVKRRTIAQELCEAGRVQVNGRAAKPSREVRAGDILTVHFTSRTVVVEMLSLPGPPKLRAPEALFRVLSEERAPREEGP
jgi:ribosomal 50S subunit-recycling heat shock protein